MPAGLYTGCHRSHLIGALEQRPADERERENLRGYAGSRAFVRQSGIIQPALTGTGSDSGVGQQQSLHKENPVRIAVAIVLIVHAVAHLVGFIAPWKIATLKEAPYKTTLLAGALDVGDAGIRIVGVMWLIAAVAFVLAAIGVLVRRPWWRSLTLYVAVSFLILCILGSPESIIGILVNGVILAYLGIGGRLG